jgi:phosphoribosyl 1,2-cyclic phosphodiesterase
LVKISEQTTGVSRAELVVDTIKKSLLDIDWQGFQVCSLGSGSKGNGTLICFGDYLILVDCGFSVKETIRRLECKGVAPEQVCCILVTHEHSDHLSGVARFSNRFSIPVWLNKGANLHKNSLNINNKFIFNTHQSFELGPITVTPVAVPHDAREAVQFIFSNKEISVGILTDIGHISSYVLEAYKTCNLLLLEFNYDLQMLLSGKYPQKLKQRVAGSFGHLSNDQAVDFLGKMEQSTLQLLVATHMSEENNSTNLVMSCIEKNTEIDKSRYLIADQSNGFSWQKI